MQFSGSEICISITTGPGATLACGPDAVFPQHCSMVASNEPSGHLHFKFGRFCFFFFFFLSSV